MERVKALIDKLYQQKEQGATPSQLLLTVQLLQTELLQHQPKNMFLGTAKVAVTLPVHYNFEEPVREIKEVLSNKTETFSKEIPVEVKNSSQLKTQENYSMVYEGMEEIPTLVHHEEKLVQHEGKKEVHEILTDSKESLNDRLKQTKIEVASVLKDTPIKDLRKGIGINERFAFVKELFRDDDVMYERSIKTINSFGILSEAEYWIKRELKFKLGWDDTNEVVQHFYQLVRRRFS